MTFASGKQLLDIKKVLTEHVGMKPAMKVADLGCGNGYNSVAAAEVVGSRGQVYAVDILKNALKTVDQEARHHNLQNIKTIWSNIEIPGATAIPHESLDVALVIHTLYQVQHVMEFMQETLRLVKPGGTIAIIDWQKDGSPIGPPPNHRIAADDIRHTLASVNGLKLVSEFNPGQYHYGLLYKKLESS